jgi:hypothetical protein
MFVVTGRPELEAQLIASYSEDSRQTGVVCKDS